MSNHKRGDNVVIAPDLMAFDQTTSSELAPVSLASSEPSAAKGGGGGSGRSVTGVFEPSTGELTVTGSNSANTIEVSRDAYGAILLNGGTASISGGVPTVANTTLITINGRGGDDVITLNEIYGALPPAHVYGGAGSDTITGGSSNDWLFGEDGNDTLNGRGGADLLYGGDGNDVLTGGDGNDTVYGEAGNDRMIWNPGDDSDVMEGGTGIDTVEVNGGNGAETFTISANGARVRFDRLDPAPFTLDIGTTEQLIVNMGGGNDTISAAGNLASLINIKIDGGTGDDTIFGSNGADVLLGGDGDDFVDGQQGSDIVDLGAGDDVFRWDPGDGSDVVEGGTGVDALLFNANNTNETLVVSGNSGRLSLTRDVGNIVMDVNDIEKVAINAYGGADTVTIGDLSGTDATDVTIDLTGFTGGTSGDAQVDTVTVNGAGSGDSIDVYGAPGTIVVAGLSALVTAVHVEAQDQLVVNGQGGNDTLAATTLGAGVVTLTLDGGAGNDTILGSNGADVLVGGDGNDFVFGDNGNDLALLGAGDDVFEWDPGDGSDTVEGQEGLDTLLFNASNATESISIAANLDRARLTRDVGNVVMDLNDVERIDLSMRGGADNVVVGDLTGTDVQEVRIDLGTFPGGTGDGAIDQVAVDGSQVDDVIQITANGGEIIVTGTAATLHLSGAEPGGTDRLIVNGLGGGDTIDASGLAANIVSLTLNGGLGSDILVGGAGNDLFNGGDGNDVALMGAGDDTFVWNPGDDNDTVDGQSGFDTLLLNGANVAEHLAIVASGGHAQLTRDVANVTMDLNGMERIQLVTRGGADVVSIGGLSGTGVAEVAIDLSAAGGGGGGDAQADSVIVAGTAGDDVVLLVGDASGVGVLGLSASISVTGGDAGLDTVVIDGGSGDDVIDASGVAAGAVKLVLNGGDGNDVIIGSDGDDIIYGGPGDDVIIGGLGNDIIDGGDGNDIEIQGFTAGAGSEDAVDLSGRGYTFDWLIAHATESNGSTVLDLGDHQITLTDVSLASLHQDDFLL